MKKVIFFMLFFASYEVFAQIEKGRIHLSAGIGFRSLSGESEISGYTDTAMAQFNRPVDKSNGSQISTEISVGYFIAPGFEVGISGSYSNSSAVTKRIFDKYSGAVYPIGVVSPNNPNLVEFDDRTTSVVSSIGVYGRKYWSIGGSEKWFWNVTTTIAFIQEKNSITEVYAYDPGNFFAPPYRSRQFASREADDIASPNAKIVALGIAPGINYFINKNWAVGATLGNVLNIGYAKLSATRISYVNNNKAGGYPQDTDKITQTWNSSEFYANAQLPFISSGSLLISMSYFLR